MWVCLSLHLARDSPNTILHSALRFAVLLLLLNRAFEPGAVLLQSVRIVPSTPTRAEPVEEVSKLVRTEFFYAEAPEVFEHALMFQVALERANALPATELFHVADSAEDPVCTIPLFVLPPLKVILWRSK